MHPCADLRVLFRVAAGPRRGFGHLVRCLSLARAMGVRPLLCLRGPEVAVETALSLGADVLTDGTPRSIRLLRPDVLVVDDPAANLARPWIAAARRAGAVVVTIHDLGIGLVDGDVVIDGSVTSPARPGRRRVALSGARYAIVDPALPRNHRVRHDGRRVLVALGGGRRRRTALDIARAITAADPRAEVRIAGGFSSPGPRATDRNIAWIGPARGLGRELSRANVAVVGGGVSLYEACAAGVPAVGVPVVPSQRPTVSAFARRGAAIGMPFGAAPARTAAAVVALLDDPRRRAVLQRRAAQLVDGRGAERAAAAVLAFVKRT